MISSTFNKNHKVKSRKKKSTLLSSLRPRTKDFAIVVKNYAKTDIIVFYAQVRSCLVFLFCSKHSVLNCNRITCGKIK